MITVITPTHDRPAGIYLLHKYMARQTVQPDEWLVIDDGGTPARVEATHVRRKSGPRGAQSLTGNMREGLDRASGDIILIMEDDDWYAPDHIEVCIEGLKRADATGHNKLRYFNIEHMRWKVMPNRGAALCNTAFTRQALPKMVSAVEEAHRREQYCIDGIFWRSVPRKMHSNATVVGIKGIPGSRGLGIGHKPAAGWNRDLKGEKLREWIGSDAAFYLG